MSRVPLEEIFPYFPDEVALRRASILSLKTVRKQWDAVSMFDHPYFLDSACVFTLAVVLVQNTKYMTHSTQQVGKATCVVSRRSQDSFPAAKKKRKKIRNERKKSGKKGKGKEREGREIYPRVFRALPRENVRLGWAVGARRTLVRYIA